MAGILAAPLVVIGGVASSRGYITLFMHDGFDRPFMPAGEIAGILLERDELEPGLIYLVHGDTANPYCSWPIYAVRG